MIKVRCGTGASRSRLNIHGLKFEPYGEYISVEGKDLQDWLIMGGEKVKLENFIPHQVYIKAPEWLYRPIKYNRGTPDREGTQVFMVDCHALESQHD